MVFVIIELAILNVINELQYFLSNEVKVPPQLPTRASHESENLVFRSGKWKINVLINIFTLEKQIN